MLHVSIVLVPLRYWHARAVLDKWITRLQLCIARILLFESFLWEHTIVKNIRRSILMKISGWSFYSCMGARQLQGRRAGIVGAWACPHHTMVWGEAWQGNIGDVWSIKGYFMGIWYLELIYTQFCTVVGPTWATPTTYHEKRPLSRFA